MKLRSLLFLALVSAALATNASAQNCERLKSLNIPTVTIVSATTVPAGPWRPAAQGNGPAPAAIQLPAHCRVNTILKPSTDSNIEMELWLPDDWNNKYEAVGNGGWAGVISFPAMAAALKEGYATSSTDTGHKGGSAVFAPGHPEKLIDYGWRSEHEMAVQSKLIIKAYYGREQKLSYWNGCSTGGKQGLMEAQRFPEDFDAILAGAPANFQTHLHAWTVWVGHTNLKDAEARVPVAKFANISKAAIAACDMLDGVKDGLLDDPRKCTFDPAKMLCAAGTDTPECLTAKQVETVKTLYSAPKFNNGTVIFPPYTKSSEIGWNLMAGGPEPAGVGVDTFRYVTYNKPDWDWRTFDLDKDTRTADEVDRGIINATNPDLSKFKARGGKLLQYHGWIDQLIAPENSINYYNEVQTKMGKGQESWYRLFMVPGMQHCRGGPGLDNFNAMAALERWREGNEAPNSILAAHVVGGNIEMSRPLCPYPQVAKYKGTGSVNDAGSYACRVP
jgi:feruloyl esterase